MRWVALGVAVIVAVASMGSPRLSLHVTPIVLFEGADVRIQCRVPLDADNRRLQLAIEGYRYSEWPIDGANGPVTTEVTYAHVPCDVSVVSCTVLAVTGKAQRIATGIQVVCRS